MDPNDRRRDEDEDREDRRPRGRDPDRDDDRRGRGRPPRDDPRDPRDADDARDEVERADREREKAVAQAIEGYAKLATRYQEDGRRPPVSAWLLIRYQPPDLGLRPIPGGTNFWTSPDIWVESSDPMGNPVAGQANFVHARIFNLGEFTAAPVRVDFFWGDPSLGLGPGTMNRINPADQAEWVEVPSMRSVDVRCRTPWIPAVVNGGHECLMVHCTCPTLDPITAPFQPQLDRHVGQRNLHVVEAAPGSAFTFRVALHNTLALGGHTRVFARAERVLATAAARKLPARELLEHVAAFGGPAVETADEMRHRFVAGAPGQRATRRLARLAARRPAAAPLLRAGGEAGGAAQAAPGIAARLLDGGVTRRPVRGREATARLLQAADQLAGGAACVNGGAYTTLQELRMQPFEQRGLELELRVPADVRAGEYVVFHVGQQVEGMVTGGYTIVVRTPKYGGEHYG